MGSTNAGSRNEDLAKIKNMNSIDITLRRVILTSMFIGIIIFGIFIGYNIRYQKKYYHITKADRINSVFKFVGSEKGDSYIQLDSNRVFALDDLRNKRMGYNLNDIVFFCDSIFKKVNSDTLFLVKRSKTHSFVRMDVHYYFIIE